MEYVVVTILVSLAILFVGRHFYRIAKGESGCDCCDCGKECSSRKTDDCSCDSKDVKHKAD